MLCYVINMHAYNPVQLYNPIKALQYGTHADHDDDG